MLDNPNEPVSDLSYFDCIESVMENSKVLGESMAGISQNAKTGDLPAFGECVGVASKALCGLTEAAAQVRDWLVPSPCSVPCVLCLTVGAPGPCGRQGGAPALIQLVPQKPWKGWWLLSWRDP